MTNETSSATPNEFQFELQPNRPSVLFGKRLTFQRSTALNFHPDTLLRACTGRGLIRHIEQGNSYKYYRALLAFVRSIENGSTMQKRSREDAVTASKSQRFRGREATPEDLVEMQGGLAAPWRMLWRSAHSGEPDAIVKRLIARFAAYDRGAHQITLAKDEAKNIRLRRQWMGDAANYWDASGLRVSPWAAIALDSTLQHLAWLDTQDIPAFRPAVSQSVLSMSKPSKAPLRHWFDELLRQTRYDDLNELAKFLELQSQRGTAPEISAQLLRHWASTQFLISIESATELLGALSPKVSPERELYRLMLARLLTFLVDVILCFSEKPVTEESARTAIHNRLLQLDARTRAAKG